MQVANPCVLRLSSFLGKRFDFYTEPVSLKWFGEEERRIRGNGVEIK